MTSTLSAIQLKLLYATSIEKPDSNKTDATCDIGEAADAGLNTAAFLGAWISRSYLTANRFELSAGVGTRWRAVSRSQLPAR